MSWGFEAVAEQHPEAFAAYVAYVDTVWSSPTLPAGTLELCRLRIVQLLGTDAEAGWRLGNLPPSFEELVGVLPRWPTDPRFAPVDRACLAFAEQFLMDTQALDDATAAEVRCHVGDAGLVTLAIGVGLAEGLTRAVSVLGGEAPRGALRSLGERVVGAS